MGISLKNIVDKAQAKPKANKHGAKKAIVDGIKFDSKKESRRYGVLKLLQRAGEISDLQMQVKYPLVVKRWEVNGEMVEVGLNGQAYMRSYVADFVYTEKGRTVVEDVKSSHTKTLRPYKIKKLLMKKVYNIEIHET